MHTTLILRLFCVHRKRLPSGVSEMRVLRVTLESRGRVGRLVVARIGWHRVHNCVLKIRIKSTRAVPAINALHLLSRVWTMRVVQIRKRLLTQLFQELY
uniref:Secreted protein n=1 Tax=Knipowitschia caucasica TaxID=637954 RepID=A0AAV2J7A2_KNICA